MSFKVSRDAERSLKALKQMKQHRRAALRRHDQMVEYRSDVACIAYIITCYPQSCNLIPTTSYTVLS